MIRIFAASATSEFGPHERDGKVVAGSTGEVSKMILEVRDDGSWTGSVKVWARLIGQGKARGLTHAASNQFVGNLNIVNLLTDAIIAGGTGITVAGLYMVDISGMEVAMEHTRATGTLSCDAHVCLG